MGNTISTESKLWLNEFPTEIILSIFDYLSNNDIIYTFFHLHQRFNNLLLQHHRYLNYFELPITNLNTWKTILPIIGSQIKILNVKTFYFSFPLTYFSNLKSLIISSRYGLPDEQLKSIIESEQFQNLYSFKIQTKEYIHFYHNYLFTEYNDIFKNIFNSKNSLKIFHSSIIIPPSALYLTSSFQTNHNLHSLTLRLNEFNEIFSLIEYTPNLKYLNIQSKQSNRSQISFYNNHIKLEKFDFLLKKNKGEHGFHWEELINFLQHFSLTLTYLSLNLVDNLIRNTDEIPCNSIKLQQFLESMIQLQQFHLYAKLSNGQIDSNFLLSQYENEYWFNQNFSFGMHRNYFYTLPFHFNDLYECYEDFDLVKSNNSEILINNSRIWYNVKSIELSRISKYDRNFVKQLKINMPKLTLIKFIDCPLIQTQTTFTCNDEREDIDLRLENVTTIHFVNETIEDIANWIKYSLPNLNQLILTSVQIPSIDDESLQILNEKIIYLDIYYGLKSKQLTHKNCFNLSNIQYINFNFNCRLRENQAYTYIMKNLTKVKNLNTLFLYMYWPSYVSAERESTKFVKYFNKNKITKKYQVEHIQEYSLFIKHELNNNETEDDLPLTRRKSTCFSKLNCFFPGLKRS